MESSKSVESDDIDDSYGPVIAKKRRTIQYYPHASRSTWKGYWNIKGMNQFASDQSIRKGRSSNNSIVNTPAQESNLEKKIESFKPTYRYQNRIHRIATIGSSNVIKQPQIKNFNCNIQELVKKVDAKYSIKGLFSKEMSTDNTIRLYTTKNNGKSYVARAFFKGDPSQCTLINNQNLPGFKENQKDCEKHIEMNKRLTTEKSYTDIEFPICVEANSETSGESFFYEIFELPKGENLHDKCIKQNIQDYDDTNSCIPYLKTIATGVLHGVDILNRGTTFIEHGNLTPKNIYLQITTDKKLIFLDNFTFTPNPSTDITKKPEKTDLNTLGSTLLKIIAGTEDIGFAKDSSSGYEIYCKTLKHFKEKGVSVDLKSSFLGVPQILKSGSSKLGSLEEFKEKFEGSIFNFIFYLMSSETNSSQALLNKYIASKAVLSEDDSPADY
jgi:hypothetical protein